MIGLDTNVLARFLLDDDPAQSPAAQRLLDGSRQCTVPLTVWLELAWVLEARGLGRADVARGLRTVLGLANVKAQSPLALAHALVWFEQGLDFADALHLAQCGSDDAFASFDLKLARRANKLGAQPTVVKPG